MSVRHAHHRALHHHLHLSIHRGGVGAGGRDEEVGTVVRGGEHSGGTVVGVTQVADDVGQDENIVVVKVLVCGDPGVEADVVVCKVCGQRCGVTVSTATSGVTVSMSAFLACHQCYCAGSSLAWGLNLRAVVCGIF